jgi:hypothetical protein
VFDPSNRKVDHTKTAVTFASLTRDTQLAAVGTLLAREDRALLITQTGMVRSWVMNSGGTENATLSLTLAGPERTVTSTGGFARANSFAWCAPQKASSNFCGVSSSSVIRVRASASSSPAGR